MSKRKFRLLTKVVFFYLLITLASFIISALILQAEADKHMHHILESRFKHKEHFIVRILKHKPEKISRLHHTAVKEVDDIPDGFTPEYKDTIIFNDQTQREEVFRKKTNYLNVDGQVYKVEMSKEAEELYRFRDDIFHIILPILGILVIVIVIANYLLSGFLLEPFRRILRQMSTYKIGTPGASVDIQTSTQEFHQLKVLYSKMRKRIEDDYFQLKEYTENMSHELQTPLSIIQNKTEYLLSENNLNTEQVKRLKAVYDEIQHLSKLGSALNLITKIENNEFQDIQTVKTAPVIRNHINTIEEMAEMKQLKLQTRIDETHVFNIDPGLLDILIRNLLKNALRYSVANSTIMIETDNKDFIIKNQGDKLDFPEDEIFTRFKKGKKGKHAIGLGLAIVKKICIVSGLDITYSFNEGIHKFRINPMS